MRKIGEMYDDDFRYEGAQVRRMTPVRLFLMIVGVFLALGLLFGVIGFASGWFNKAASVVSPENVSQQWQFAYDYDKALGAIAGNWCSAKEVETAATGDEKSQRTSQRLAQENLYRTRQAEYDARLADAFRAKLVKPSDVPTTAPTLKEKVVQLDLTCGS